MLNYRKHNLWRAFVDFLFDNDRKVASSYKSTQIKAGVQKPYPSYDQDSQNQLNYPIYDQNSWKTVPFRAAHT